MKKLMISMLLLMSTGAFAGFGGWVFNNSKCVAKTICPNGKVLTCSTVAANYGYGYQTPANFCRTRVIPGLAIQCQGFSDKPTVFGGISFVPTNFSLSCY